MLVRTAEFNCPRRYDSFRFPTVGFSSCVSYARVSSSSMHNERCPCDCVYQTSLLTLRRTTRALQSAHPPRLVSYPHHRVIKVNEVNLRPTCVVIKRTSWRRDDRMHLRALCLISRFQTNYWGVKVLAGRNKRTNTSLSFVTTITVQI